MKPVAALAATVAALTLLGTVDAAPAGARERFPLAQTMIAQQDDDDCPAGRRMDDSGDCVDDDSGGGGTRSRGMIPGPGGYCPPGMALYDVLDCLCRQDQYPGGGTCLPCSQVGRHEECR